MESFFVAGLLHDIGRFVLATGSGEAMTAAIDDARQSGRDLLACEREHLGCTHTEVGGALLERWHFPPELQEPARFHHQPMRATLFPVEVATIHVSDIIAHALEWGRSGQPRVPTFESRAWNVLGLDERLIPSVVEEAGIQLDAAESLLAAESAQ